MVELTFRTSPALVLVCLVLAAAAAGWLYRKVPGGTPGWLAWLLRALRGMAVFLLALLLLEPLWTALRPTRTAPTVVILQDVSQSLAAQVDSNALYGDYLARVAGLKNALERAGAQVRIHPFGEATADATNRLDTLAFTAGASNPAAALEAVERRYSAGHLVGVVFATDGIPTEGTSPLYAATRLGVPVYSVLVGDTVPKRDIALEAVLHNELGYLNNTTEVQARIGHTGYAGQRVVAVLVNGAEVIGRETVTLPAAGVATVNFTLPLKAPGLQAFDIRIAPATGERTYRNNQRRFYIQVLDNRQKVLLLAGAPHPDLGAIEAALGRSNRFSLVSRVRRSLGEFYQPLSPGDVKAADLVILHNFPASAADVQVLEQLYAEVESRQLALFHIVGSTTRLSVHPEQRAHMALFLEEAAPGASEVLLAPTNAYQRHSTYTFDAGFQRYLSSAPPLRRPEGIWEAQRSAEIFATATIKGVALDYPVLAIEPEDGRKNAVLLGENLWRLRVHNYVEQGDFEYFDTWLENLVQWLTVREDRRRFKVLPTQRLFEGDAPVRFKGQVYDESYNPLEGVEIELGITDSSGTRDAYYLSEVAPGSYGQAIRGLAPGTYRYDASGTLRGQPVGKDGGVFTVGRSNVEFARLTADAQLLRQIGLRTGGGFFTWETMGAVADSLTAQPRFAPLVAYNRQSVQLREVLWPLLLVLLLLSAEWVLRKRYGMV